MKKYLVKLGQNLNVVTAEKNDNITMNAKQSQFFVATLDKWTLTDGDELFVSFRKKDKTDNSYGPYQLLYNAEFKAYSVLFPDGLLAEGGTWEYSIEHRYDVETDDDGNATHYYSHSSTTYSISIEKSVSIKGNDIISEHDLSSLAANLNNALKITIYEEAD